MSRVSALVPAAITDWFVRTRLRVGGQGVFRFFGGPGLPIQALAQLPFACKCLVKLLGGLGVRAGAVSGGDQRAHGVDDGGAVHPVLFGGVAVVSEPLLGCGALMIAEQLAASVPAAFHAASEAALILGEGVEIRNRGSAGRFEQAFQEPYLLYQALHGLVGVVDALA
ncbi:hypothetical protein ABT030_44050 [Streptomyces mirabilis]|uniref:hypothetical protein n=1 Tax=Streptomyces mirabilis TaxID=68239 RepID=UPI00331DA02C